MTALAKPDLADLAERIREAYGRAKADAVSAAEYCLETGRVLIEAKAACGHGAWLPFLESTGLHERQARRLMQLARSGLKSDTVSDLGIRGALEFLAEPRPRTVPEAPAEPEAAPRELPPDPAPREPAPARGRTPTTRERDGFDQLCSAWNGATKPERDRFLAWIGKPPVLGGMAIDEAIWRLGLGLKANRFDAHDRGFVAGLLHKSKNGGWHPTEREEAWAARILRDLAAPDDAVIIDDAIEPEAEA
jgi:hypothetical protein